MGRVEFLDRLGNPIPNAAENVETFLRIQDVHATQDLRVRTTRGVEVVSARDTFAARRPILAAWLLNRKPNSEAAVAKGYFLEICARKYLLDLLPMNATAVSLPSQFDGTSAGQKGGDILLGMRDEDGVIDPISVIDITGTPFWKIRRNKNHGVNPTLQAPVIVLPFSDLFGSMVVGATMLPLDEHINQDLKIGVQKGDNSLFTATFRRPLLKNLANRLIEAALHAHDKILTDAENGWVDSQLAEQAAVKALKLAHMV